MRYRLTLVVTGLLLLLQGCASTDELYAQYDKKACIQPVPVGITMGLVTAVAGMPWHIAVYFELDGDELDPNAIERLDENLAALNADPGYRVLIRGFTDSIASDSYNLKLAERRVASVVGYLENAGIHTSRITVQPAFGEEFPVNENISEDQRSANRRVEMLLMDEDGRILSVQIDDSEQQ